MTKIAYFSMEIGMDSKIPTYSGGLGVLAGDTLRSCADLGVPVVGVTLVSRKGYFYQKIDNEGKQVEEDYFWNPGDLLEALDKTVSVRISGREVKVTAWKYRIIGIKGAEVPVILLDTDHAENTASDRTITDKLYGGDSEYRLKQEMVLGIGGVKMLEALGYNIETYHMNEGHSSLLTLELVKRTENLHAKDQKKRYDFEKVRKMCVFTTHTPVPAGHDQFEPELAKKLISNYFPEELCEKCLYMGKLNMTHIGLSHSHYINGVAKKHGEISRDMFPDYPIDSITNGVHALTWTGPSMQMLYDKHMPGWNCDPFMLRYALGIPRPEIWDAHMLEKQALIDYVKKRYGLTLMREALTIGFARRSTSYKRAKLIFYDIERLKAIAKDRPLQLIFAGKAHPMDLAGKDTIRDICDLRDKLGDNIKLVYLENYNMEKAKKIIAGVDVWLNTPLRPREASGTSGMKAALNGVLNFSTLDGWWLEGHLEDITGWSIGPKRKEEECDNKEDADDLYRKLQDKIIPMYYDDNENWVRMMRHSIAFNGSFFNTHRMVQQYVLNAYFD